jgi:MFS transporter, CP family, cyanate transporter
MKKKENEKYGWIIVAIFILAAFTYQYTQYQLTIVGKSLMSALQLTAAQFTSIFTAPLIPAIFLSLIVGIIADKAGMKLIIAAGMLLSCIGGIGHVFAGSYGSLFSTMLLTGLGAVAVNVTCGKMFSMWIKKEYISMVMGAFLAASTVGQFVAQSTTALLSSFTTAFWISGILCCIVFILWILLGKEKKAPLEAAGKSPSIKETAKIVFGNKNMWLCAAGLFLILGCQVAFNTWIPAALTSKGMSISQAGLVSSMVSFGNLCGALLSPIIAAKIGKDKPVILLFTLICAAGYAFGWKLNGVACYLLFFIFGMCAAGLMPLYISMPLKFNGIGPAYAGTAIGLISTAELLGGVVIPTYIVLPLATRAAGVDFTRYFSIIGIGWLIAFIIGILLPETAVRKDNI